MDEQLTGRLNYRTNWRGKLILQVEVVGRPYDSSGGGSYGPQYTRYRDAKASELCQYDIVLGI